MYKKFIIYGCPHAGDHIRLGHVDFHKELGPDKSLIKGGGWWYFDKEKDIMYLYSSSQDFGYVKREDLINAIENGMLSLRHKNTKFFHSFADFLDDAMIDKTGIWIQHKSEEDV